MRDLASIRERNAMQFDVVLPNKDNSAYKVESEIGEIVALCPNGFVAETVARALNGFSKAEAQEGRSLDGIAT